MGESGVVGTVSVGGGKVGDGRSSWRGGWGREKGCSSWIHCEEQRN